MTHRKRAWLMALVLVYPSGALSAQASGRGHGVSVAARVQGGRCGLCHVAHGQTGGAVACAPEAMPKLLRPAETQAGDPPGTAACLAAGPELASARGVSPVSRSCLRCHATAEVRAKDPALAATLRPGAAGAPPDSAFLGDLVDDHPLALSPDAAGNDARSTLPVNDLGRSRRRPLLGTALTTAARPECTSCHQVHRGPDPALGEDGRAKICLTCHEPSRYLVHRSGVACADCHAPHGGNQAALLVQPTVELLCRSCHDRNAAAQGVVAPATPLDLDAHVRSTGSTKTCVDCHPAHR